MVEETRQYVVTGSFKPRDTAQYNEDKVAPNRNNSLVSHARPASI